ncbi:NAD(P)/FAD-dependent oxidoreductase [Pseudonocardia xinjiangensis]|uniref:NAD(P)/FAD-dependent oxidoreductase n=1 Tax=Pseudonocardia xinjiangensis TaxID=75289 RepID=UPI003D902F59
MDDNTHSDVIVIGGGAAGLSGALTLARARRSVLVLDDGHPRNAPADGVHGFLSRDGIAPSELVGLGAAEVTGYGATILHTRVTSARPDGDGFVVGTDSGRTVTARRLLVTTGLVDELPDLPGVAPRFGRDVLHCPYCHGWEVRDQPIGVLGTGPFAAHQALLFRQWSDDVTLFLHTAPAPAPDESEQLAARGITVVEGEVAALESSDVRLTGVRLVSGRVVPVKAVTVMPRFTARSDVLTGLGLTTVEHPMGIGTHIETDDRGLTAVPGVWAAGNVTDLLAQVIGAAAAGVTAGAAINADLIADDTRVAVERHRELQQSHVAATGLPERGFAATAGELR